MTDEKNIFVYVFWWQIFQILVYFYVRSVKPSPLLLKKVGGRLITLPQTPGERWGECTLWYKFINYAYFLQNKSILLGFIRKNPLLSCLHFVIEHKSLCYLQVYLQRFCKHWLDKIKKAYFQHHSETDCNICNISMAKHQNLTNAHIKLFDKKFSNHQFCRYNQGASRDLIYFKPVISKSKVYVPLTIANKGWSDMECIFQWRYWILFNSWMFSLSPPLAERQQGETMQWYRMFVFKPTSRNTFEFTMQGIY